jgi:hypothetical protein
MDATAELVKKKLELLAQQKAKADRINELLSGARLPMARTPWTTRDS